jgi:ParB family chromosome partitioning protein
MVNAREVPLSKIQKNRFNPRIDFDETELEALANNIRRNGLLQPIIVRPIGDHFEVVVGERRYRACQKAGLENVPVIIREYSDAEVLELSLIENVQRSDLSAVEKGNSCKQLMEKYPAKFPTRTKVAEVLNISERTLNAWLELVDAPKELQTLIAPAAKIGVPREQGKIDWDTAVTITRQIREPEKQVTLAKEIAKRSVYRRQAREVISKAAKEPEKPIQEIFKEIVEAPYDLPFRLSHMNPILNGSKVQTSRKGLPDPKIAVGKVVHAAVWEPHFADLKILSVQRKKLGDFTETDAKREGGYTLEQFKKVWIDLHGVWNDNETVIVINFEAVKKKA